ncbi:MAG: alkylation response protein AidB-like acyl-CoA dehydrogenase [Halieaceae bacterium]|jgi:alkylation response protein AidB-like acyl-CoA dehydrogenase
MDFGFSDNQREVKELAHRILGEQVSPESLAVYDEYQSERYDQSLWQHLLTAGLPGVAVSENHGGMGFGFTELALFIEELGRVIAPTPAIPHCVSAMLALQQFAPDKLQQRYLPGAISGERLLTAALFESLLDSSIVATSCTGLVTAAGMTVSGSKTAVPFAAQADRVLLALSCEGDVAVVLVDPKREGVTLVPMQATTFEPQCKMILQDVVIDDVDIVLASGGAILMEWLAQRTTAAVCVHQLGAAEAAMRMAASYTSERKQFGVPVATFQAVGHRLADCYIDIECLRLTSYQAVSLLAAGRDAQTELQIAKIWAGDCGHRVSYACQHVHGGTGIDRDYPLWRYCLWLRSNEMLLGGSASQLADLGARLAKGEALFD